MSVDVYIINRDFVTWPRKITERLKTLDDIGRIIVVDNNSTYGPCLDWYNEDKSVIFHRLGDNIGHRCVWDMGIPDQYKSHEYVVTDPDLDISEIPDDTLIHLRECYNERPHLNKMGLSLMVDDVPDDSFYFVSQWERFLWRTNQDDKVFFAPVDTTFAYYILNRNRNYKIGGARTKPPYTCRHLPWYYTKEMLSGDDEFLYYLKHANSSSTLRMKSRVVKRIMNDNQAE